MKKLGIKLSKGFVYIISNTKDKKTIKIGRTHKAPEERALEFTKHPATKGEFIVEWALEVDQMYLAERILHHKFIKYWEDGENFKFPVKLAIRITKLLMDSFQKEITKDGRLIKVQKTNASENRSVSIDTVSKWESKKETKKKRFLKQVIDLCLKEGRPGSPKLERFMSIRTNKYTKIGVVNFYIQKEHIRITIENEVAIREKSKRAIKSKFKYYEVKCPSIIDWRDGIQFRVENDVEFEVIKKWLKLGNE
jgi:T5orf172 domain